MSLIKSVIGKSYEEEDLGPSRFVPDTSEKVAEDITGLLQLSEDVYQVPEPSDDLPSLSEKVAGMHVVKRYAETANRILSDPLLGKIAMYCKPEDWVPLAEGRYGTREELDKLAIMGREEMLKLAKTVL